MVLNNLTLQLKVRVNQSKDLFNILKSLSQTQKTKVVTCDEYWFLLWYLVDCFWKKTGEHIEYQKYLKNNAIQLLKYLNFIKHVYFK